MFFRRGRREEKNGAGVDGSGNGPVNGSGGEPSKGRAKTARGSRGRGAGEEAAGTNGASRERGKALREGARTREGTRAGGRGAGGTVTAPADVSPGDRAPQAPGGRRSRKPAFSRSGGQEGRGNGPGSGPGETPPGHYRPQGSLLPEPVPSAEHLPEPEKLFGTKRDLLSRLTAYAMAGSLLLLLFLLLFLPLRYMLTGGGSVGEGGPAVAASETATEARALAEPFAAAYLEVNPGEGPQASQARVTPFLADELPADVVAGQNEGEAERRILSTSVYRTEKLREDRWAVYTENLVATTSQGEPAEEDPLNAESLSEVGASFTAPDGESTTTVRRVGLLVYVAAAPSGVAVDAPPRMVAPRGGFGGEPGAIVAEEPQALADGPVRDLLEGYLAAAYGSDVSRESITNFLVPGSTPPPQPAFGMEFLGLEDGVVYEAPVPRGSEWGQAYEVEAYVSVRDPEAGTTSTQTHVLTVAETDDGWKVAGGPGSVSE